MASSHPIVKLGDYIQEEGTKYNISDKTKTYGILGVNNQTGIFDAYEENGSKIKQKYKKMQVGWIAYNPYRVNVGSIGIRTEEQLFEYISPAYVVFSCKKGLLPEFLFLLMKTDLFNKIIRENTTGSVRQNLNYSVLSNLQIPLPSLGEQNKIIAAYRATIAQAKQYSTQAKDIDEQIEKYLQDELGIPSLQDECKNAVFRDTPYKFICLHQLNDMSDRWDLYNTPHSIFDVLRKSQYPIKQIGDVFHFVTRGWKKVGEEFNYIEIGDVIPILGITGKQKLKVKKAPSRATQVVKTGDLIIGTTRPYLKRFAIVNEDYNNDICSSGFQVIESKKDYNIKYLLEFLLTSYAVEQFEYYMTGALYPAITSKDLRKLQIPLPPLNIQDEIVDHITALRTKQKNLQQKSLTLRQQATQQFEQTIFSVI
jgi:restriction endonuclease S subunit